MLIDRLRSDDVDVIGDVHGEIEVLAALLGALGYDSQGGHPAGRQLVFVGDLVDRGPGSAAVVDLVRDLVAAERAQCVLGNHELNLLRGENKEGNDWFSREDARTQARALEFFASLPLALERDDLRVVHACWHDRHVSDLRENTRPVSELSRHFHDMVDRELERDGALKRADSEMHVPIDDRERPPPMLAARAEVNIRRQNDNPIKVLTSGLERLAKAPFWASGKWRFETRDPWWNDYHGPMVVIGHYWRPKTPGRHHTERGPDLFEGLAPTQPLGPEGNVMCIDYAIGERSNERLRKRPPYDTALAAYRWPEREVVFSPA